MAKIKLSRKYTVFTMLFAALSTLAVLGNAVIPAEDSIIGSDLLLVGPLIQILARIRYALPDAKLLGIVVLVAMLSLYQHYFLLRSQGKLPKSRLFFALSVLFAFFILCGTSFQSFGSLAFLFQSEAQMVYALLLLGGLTALFYVTCSFLLRALEEGRSRELRSSRLSRILLDTHSFLIPFLFLLLCWLPYWIACFPGSVSYDMNYQWSSFLGYIPMSGHHPVFSTLLYGYLLQFLRTFFNDTVCLALCSAAQFVVMAICFAYGLSRMRRWGVSQNLRLFTLLFFSLNPLIPIWLQLLVKDCIYFAFFFVFTVALLDLILAIVNQRPIGKALLWAMLWGTLTSLMRNNGIYIIAPSLFLILAVSKYKKQKTIIGFSAIFTVLIISVISNGLLNFYGASKGPLAEMLSIPFQQTARYVRQYEAEVTPEEREVLNLVLDVDILPQVYDPDISDPVKNARVPGYEAHIGEYLAVWAKMFCKHPMVYLEATLHNTYAYLSPAVDSPKAVMAAVSIEQNPYPILDAQYAMPDGARILCLNFILGIKQLPVIGVLLQVGTYTWTFLFLAVLVLYHKRYSLLLGCFPAAMNLLVCFASPVNGYYRYALPHMIIIPVLLSWLYTELYHTREEITR